MTVYFFCRVADKTMVKIGVTKTVRSRVARQTSDYGDIELIATMDGGRELEKEIHQRFSGDRDEGEWFRRTDRLDEFMRGEAIHSGVIFLARPSAGMKVKNECQNVDDALSARDLINACLDRFPASARVGGAMEKTFVDLVKINPSWTRRRLQTLRNCVGRRIELYEVVDMLTVLQVPRENWADWIRPTLEAMRRQARGQGPQAS